MRLPWTRIHASFVRQLTCIVALAAATVPLPGSAQLGPEAVFQAAAPSVFVVATKRDGKVVSAGSGVVVDEQVLVTNCHVLKDGTDIEVSRAQRTWRAYRATAFEDQDLCLLRAQDFAAPTVKFVLSHELKIGARAYSIGAPAGLELTIAEGLVSGRRSIGDRTVIQTSAPISRGSSGGGLFDAEGRLIGITTFYLKDGQNVNFVVPADAVRALTERYRQIADAFAIVMKLPGDGRPPERTFATSEERVAFLQWMGVQSERLKARMPDYQVRIEFLKTVDYEATRAGIDRQLVLTLIDALSKFRKYNTTPSGSRGFLSVPPAWFLQAGDDPRRLYETRVNLRAGLVLLRSLLDDNKGDLFVALNAYADRSMKREPPRTDAQFPNQVMHLWRTRWAYPPNQPSPSKRQEDPKR